VRVERIRRILKGGKHKKTLNLIHLQGAAAPIIFDFFFCSPNQSVAPPYEKPESSPFPAGTFPKSHTYLLPSSEPKLFPSLGPNLNDPALSIFPTDRDCPRFLFFPDRTQPPEQPTTTPPPRLFSLSLAKTEGQWSSPIADRKRKKG